MSMLLDYQKRMNARRKNEAHDILDTVTLLENLDVPEEAVGPDLIDEEHLAHPPVGGKVRPVESPLVGRGEHDKHLDLTRVLDPDDLLLKVEVLGAVVSEHHDEGLVRGVLEGHQQPLCEPLPAVPAAVKGLKHETGGGPGERSHVISVNLIMSCNILN